MRQTLTRLCVDSETLRQANAYGFSVPGEAAQIDWPTIKHKRDKYIERLNGIYERSESS
jgi:glutathione reductase (NADPH)